MSSTYQNSTTEFGKSESGLLGSAKEKAGELASSVKDAAGAIQHKAGELASSMSEGAEQAWNSTRDNAQQLGSAVANHAEMAAAELTTFVRRYPVASLFAALGIGFFAGQLIRSRD